MLSNTELFSESSANLGLGRVAFSVQGVAYTEQNPMAFRTTNTCWTVGDIFTL